METSKKGRDNKFRRAFEESAVPMIILQHNGYIFDMNRAARAVFSFTQEDRPLYTSVYITPGLPLAARRAMDKLIPYSFEGAVDFDKLRAAAPEGRRCDVIDLKIKMTPINEHNGPGGEPRADYLLEIAPKNIAGAPGAAAEIMLCQDALLLCSFEGRVLQYNEAALGLLNLNEDKVKNLSVYSLFDKEQGEELKNAVRDLYAKKPLQNKNFNLKAAKNAAPLPVETSAALDGMGNFFISFRNAAPLKQLNDLLKDRSNHLDAMNKVIDGALLECDINDGVFSNFTNANAKALNLTGMSRKALLSSSLTDALTDPEGKERKKVLAFLAAKAKQLAEDAVVSFEAKLRFQEREVYASVRITGYETEGRSHAVIIVRDTSKERILESELDYKSKELAGIKEALPGLYIKADKKGVIQDYKTADLRFNISVFPSDFVGKNPADYLDKQTVEKYLDAVSDALRTGMPVQGGFTMKYGAETRFYEATITPMKGEDNVVVMVTLVDKRKGIEHKIKDLYAISSNREAGFVKNMDDILQFGKEIFGADVGVILHFSGDDREKILVNYATENDIGITKGLETTVDECYAPVRSGMIFSAGDTKELGCKEGCLHVLKNVTSIISAPLLIGGRVEGAITFLTATPNQMFITEEDRNFMGFVGGLMGMALELRSAKKAVDTGLSTLKKLIASIDVPAVITDTNFRIKNANAIMLNICGAYDIMDIEDKNLFARFAADEIKSQSDFNSAYKTSKGGVFDLEFDLILADSKRQTILWHIVEVKDGRGSVRGYLFVSESVKDMPNVRNFLAGPHSHT